VPTSITRFKCDFCKQHYSTKSDAAKHEKNCLWNPAQKSCSTCGNAGYDTCLLNDKKIYVCGSAIKDCKDWEKPFEGELMDDW